MARIADDIFDEVRLSLDETARHLMKQIDERNADVVWFEETLRAAQYRFLKDGARLTAYRNGDESALPELLASDPQLGELIQSEGKPTLSEIQAIEDRLLLKASVGRDLKRQLSADLDEYEAEQQELADLYAKASHQLRRARVTVVIWARAHRNLATGITDPAKLNLFDVTKKAIKTVM